MSFTDFVTMIKKVPKNVEIMFAGMAEPWLNKSCTDMVLWCFDNGYQVGVYSTAVGMDEDDVRRLRCLPFQYFTIHLPDADGLMRLKVDEKYLLVLLMLMKAVPHHQKMVIGRLHPDVEKYTGPVADGSPGLISRAGNIKTLAITRKTGPLECSACGPKIDHNVLLPDGDVLLCCCDYAQQNVIGNLLEMEYNDLFESPGYMRIMEGLKDDTKEINCRYCELAKPI